MSPNWKEIRLRALSEDAPHKWLYAVAGDSDWSCDILYDTIGRQSDLHDKDMEWLWEGDIIESDSKIYEIYRLGNDELVAATNGTLRPRDALDYVSLDSLKHPITWLNTIHEHPELLKPKSTEK